MLKFLWLTKTGFLPQILIFGQIWGIGLSQELFSTLKYDPFYRMFQKCLPTLDFNLHQDWLHLYFQSSSTTSNMLLSISLSISKGKSILGKRKSIPNIWDEVCTKDLMYIMCMYVIYKKKLYKHNFLYAHTHLHTVLFFKVYENWP